MTDRHIGSNFDDFLKEEGLLEECREAAIKKVLAFQIGDRFMRLSETQIYNEAMLLPDNSKISLIEKLLESIQIAIDSDTERFQIQEAKIRRDEIRSGKVQPVIGEDVLARVRAMIDISSTPKRRRNIRKPLYSE